VRGKHFLSVDTIREIMKLSKKNSEKSCKLSQITVDVRIKSQLYDITTDTQTVSANHVMTVVLF
jgi:hypothetical protein